MKKAGHQQQRSLKYYCELQAMACIYIAPVLQRVHPQPLYRQAIRNKVAQTNDGLASENSVKAEEIKELF